MTWLLIIGTNESAKVNAVLVAIKVTALTVFIILTLPATEGRQVQPVPPGRRVRRLRVGHRRVGAAASIFFAYVGFDAVSTAAEETRDPQRNVPIGLVGSLLFCTVFYILVAAGAIGAIGASRSGRRRHSFPAGSAELAASAPCRSHSDRWSARRKRWPMCCARSAIQRSAT